MNARIKELAEQATSYKQIDGENGWFPLEVFDKEKFAELILEDIDKLIDGVYVSYPLRQAVVCLDIGYLISKHFYSTTNETSNV